MSVPYSMTGYGEGRAEDGRLRVSVAIRTVNHRFLDLQLRLPDAYRSFELELASLLRQRLVRGRVEARYRVEFVAEPALEVEVRPRVAESYRQAVRRLAGQDPAGGSPELPAAELLRLPEVVAVTAVEPQAGPEEGALLLAATESALEAVLVSRREEGTHLLVVLAQQLTHLESLHGELAAAAGEIQTELAATLARRLDELVGERGLDPARLAQEAAILADRSDVREELDRLAAHLAAFRQLLEGDGERGKRLDFLSQEVLRELNTLGSKCRNWAQIDRVVQAKTVCERLREQVQNLE